MATVSFLQATNMSALPTNSGGGSGAVFSSAEIDVSTNNGFKAYVLGAFTSSGPIWSGMISRVMIDDQDPLGFPNLDITGLSFSSEVANRVANNPFQFVADILVGDDTFIGSSGADTVRGFAGNDTVTYANSNASVAVSLPSQSGVGGHAAGDSLIDIENLIGSVFDDQFAGTAGINRLDGGGGNDFLEGGAGGDVLVGGSGIDTVSYAGSNAGVAVSLPSESGIGGHAAGDTLLGIENLVGSAFGDQFAGTSGANLFDGRGGGDHMDGGAGIDTVTYASSNASVAVSLASQSGVGGHAAGDTLINIENLIGSAFDDQFLGDAGANQFTGGGGNDFFSFNGSFGSDVIFDFTAGAGVGDVIQLDDAQFANFAAVLAATADDGFGNTAIYHAAGQISLIGVTKAQLNANDFQFV